MTPQKKAKLYWRNTQRQWRKNAQLVVQDLRKVDDELLQHTIAGVLDIIASGYGHLLVQRTTRGIEVSGYDLEVEAREALVAGIHQMAGSRVDAEQVIEAASDWLKDYFGSNSAVYLAWLLRHVRSEGTERITGFADQRLVWSVPDKKVVAVLEQDTPDSNLIYL